MQRLISRNQRRGTAMQRLICNEQVVLRESTPYKYYKRLAPQNQLRGIAMLRLPSQINSMVHRMDSVELQYKVDQQRINSIELHCKS